MAINFPNSPTNNQTYTAANGVSYIYNSSLGVWLTTGAINQFSDSFAVANAGFNRANAGFTVANASFAKANTSVQNNTTTTITTGYSVTSFNAGANVAAYGTWTPDPANGNYQFANSNGAITIATPSKDCAIDILFTNSSNANTITFSGYTAPSGGGGDTYVTTSGYVFLLMVRRINGISTFVWKALQ